MSTRVHRDPRAVRCPVAMQLQSYMRHVRSSDTAALTYVCLSEVVQGRDMTLVTPVKDFCGSQSGCKGASCKKGTFVRPAESVAKDAISAVQV